MWSKIPFLGWILSTVGAVSLSVPFWICWTWGGIGEKYFSWLPLVYQSISFWNCVGLFIVIAIIKGTLIPKLFSVSNSQNVNQG
jgi:hypothetical protein